MFEKQWPNDLGFDIVREERTPIEFSVEGHIPIYAAGVLFRNGPGQHDFFDEEGNLKYAVSHWFDGLAQLHKFELVPGADRVGVVRYSSRFTTDSMMQDMIQTGTFSGLTFAQKRDPCETLFRKFMSLFTPVPKMSLHGTNVQVNVSANTTGFPESALIPDFIAKSGHNADKLDFLVTRTDSSEMKAIDPETLESIGVCNQQSLHPLLRGPLSATHAKTDPMTGDTYNFNLDLGWESTYRVFKTSAKTGETEILATFAAPDIAPAYVHSFFMSKNYIIIAIWSAHLLQKGLRVLWERNMLDAIGPFDESKTVRWLVVDRKQNKGVVAQFETPAAYSFHGVNAYEVTNNDSIDLICETIEYGNLDILHAFYYETVRSTSAQASPWPSKGHRFARYKLCIPSTSHLPALTIPQRESKCPIPPPQTASLLSSSTTGVGDLPVMNPAYLTKPHRFFWNISVSSSHSFFHGISKIDVLTGEAIEWDGPQGHTASEPIFIADPEGMQKDDGVILTVVLDGFAGTSYLLCLDAKTLKELGRADCKGALPFSVHGQHVSISGGVPVVT